jgi:hypothetical protein
MSDKLHSPTCPHRAVADDGRIYCRMIAAGDNEVAPHLCHECPARSAGCAHLRFSLQKIAAAPITVRYATGRSEILEGQPARVSFLHAACAARVAPVNSARECAACRLHSARTVSLPAAVAASAGAHPLPAPSPTPAREGKVIAFPRRVAAAS